MDEYKIEFNHGETSTLMWVTDDELPNELALELCSRYGWDPDEITSIHKTKPVYGWDDPTTDTRAF